MVVDDGGHGVAGAGDRPARGQPVDDVHRAEPGRRRPVEHAAHEVGAHAPGAETGGQERDVLLRAAEPPALLVDVHHRRERAARRRRPCATARRGDRRGWSRGRSRPDPTNNRTGAASESRVPCRELAPASHLDSDPGPDPRHPPAGPGRDLTSSSTPIRRAAGQPVLSARSRRSTRPIRGEATEGNMQHRTSTQINGRRRWPRAVAALVALSFVAAACGGDDDDAHRRPTRRARPPPARHLT